MRPSSSSEKKVKELPMTYRNVALAATLLSGTAAGLALPALAQEAASVRDDAKVVQLSAFDVDRYKEGAWFADELRGSKVFGNDNDQVGTVQSIILNQEGQVERLVVETGGFLEIGDKVIAVPWQDIDVTPGKDGIVATSLDADKMESFSLFGDRESVSTGPRSFRASELEGDYVMLKGGEGYGYVSDLLFDKGGKLQAIIVAPDAGYGVLGYRAYPYYGYGYGFDPGLDYYGLPYAADDINEYDEPFDYDVWDDGVF
jgi:sporulation protein YlmC with PRC-barrel domain